MKKILALTGILFCLSLVFVQCSSDGGANDTVNNDSALYVDGNIFKIGTNSLEKIYNNVYEDPQRTSIKIIEYIEREPGDVIDPDVIELDFNYVGSSVDGIYPIYSTAFTGTLPANYVIGDYNTRAMFFGDSDVSGTIKITSLGNQKFKLEFNNAVFSARDNSGTRTLTGYCQAIFW
jgi:hypothetical protein